jgi:hypothetical protein
MKNLRLQNLALCLAIPASFYGSIAFFTGDKRFLWIVALFIFGIATGWIARSFYPDT